MHKWKIGFIFKYGKELTVYYEGLERNSGAVANKILSGSENDFKEFNNEDNTENIFVKLGEIISVSISAV